MGFSHIKFGRIVPKDRSYEDKYCFKKMMAVPTKKVERNLYLPLSLRRFYDQKEEGACVGFAHQWMMSIYNSYPVQQKYDGHWLYKRAQANDNDPSTDPSQDTGTFVWAGSWTLQHEGNKKPNESKIDLNDGILSYYWGKTSDDVRTAIAIGRPVLIGINWPQEFMNPIMKNGEYWIGTSKNLGSTLGGHCICIYGASDKRQAVKLVNTWGVAYPLIWLSYRILDMLMALDGEMLICVDNNKNT